MKKLLVLSAVFCLIFIFNSISHAIAEPSEQILYGVDRFSKLYTLDYVNGSTHLIGPLGISQTSAFTINTSTGAAFASPGGYTGTSGCLYGVDLTTGAAAQTGCDSIQTGYPFTDFAFHPDGPMYALRYTNGSMYLCTLDLTSGAITDIGMEEMSWLYGYSLAFISDTLYTWDTNYGLSTLGLTTASRSPIGFGDYFGFPASLDFPRIPAMAARQDGTLFGILASVYRDGNNGAADYYLVTIDKGNGDIKYIAKLPQGMQNLAFSPLVSDGCPYDPDKTAPGLCGCGIPDININDSDGDGIRDCLDACPNDPNKTAAGVCGCGVPDTDSDHDGVADCLDACPNDPNKTAAGVCGCGVPDTDANNNGIADCIDNLPDLTGSWTSLKFNTKNSTCTGRLQINNIGNVNAGALSVAYYLSGVGTSTLIATDTITGVRAGRSVAISFKYQSGASVLGKTVIAVIDSNNQIIEKFENNNISQHVIQ